MYSIFPREARSLSSSSGGGGGGGSGGSDDDEEEDDDDIEITLRKRLVPHIDSHPFQLGGVLYLSETPARSGCNTLWPGSHRIVYPTLGQEDNFVPLETFGKNTRTCFQLSFRIQMKTIVLTRQARDKHRAKLKAVLDPF